MVTLFAEGRYGSRLAAVNDFPKGFVTWHFDQAEMKKAKKVLGGNCCIMGNVPSSLMVTAQPEAVPQYYGYGDPDLGLKNVSQCPIKCFDSQVLLDSFKKQLDLPAAFIKIGNHIGKKF